MSNIFISTIILNWNRADLLKKTLESYARTIEMPFELFVIDNCSTDGSQQVILEFCRTHPFAAPIFLEKNEGGQALNLALPRCTGRYIHFSENDIEYLPNWSRVCVELFDAFPNLAQLSPFGPMPDDEEAWTPKPCVLRHSKGRFLYESSINLGTTCLLRRELIDRGLRVHNIETNGKCRFPDDIRLSKEIVDDGGMIAFAPHYLVRNLGHTIKEFDERLNYYEENYRCKIRLGVEGWRQRVEECRKRPRPVRHSSLFPDEPIAPEKSGVARDCSEPWLWSMFDGWTAEVETLEFLYALVRLVKPRQILETGTWRGFAAAAMGRALRENGRGKLVTIEYDLDTHREAAGLIARADLLDVVEVVHGSSLDFGLSGPIDFALFDSDLSIRGAEYQHFRPHFSPGALILFHDTSIEHRVVRDDIGPLFQKGELEGFFLSTPRGLCIGRFRNAQGAKGSDCAASPIPLIYGEEANVVKDSADSPANKISCFDSSGQKKPIVPREHRLDMENDMWEKDRLRVIEAYRVFFGDAFKALHFNGITGDYVEFGCHNALTFRLAYDQIKSRNLATHMWAFDSFEGLPPASGIHDAHPRWAEGAMKTTETTFREICAAHGIPRTRYEVVAGFYADVLPAFSIEKPPFDISLAYIDCDMYSSTVEALKFLKPRLKHGMIIAFDDYYCWSSTQISGERRAAIEFAAQEKNWHFTPYLQYGWMGQSFVLEDRSIMPNGGEPRAIL